MADIRFESSLTMEEIEDNFKDISSTIVRNKLLLGDDISDFVPNKSLLKQLYESNKE